MTASEYAGEQEDTSDEVDELESQRDEIDESSDGDDVQVSVPSKVIDMQLILVLIVQVAKIAKDKGKSVSSRGRDKKKKRKPKVLAGDEDSSSGKGDSRGRPMLRELPKEVRTLVNLPACHPIAGERLDGREEVWARSLAGEAHDPQEGPGGSMGARGQSGATLEAR